MMRREVYGQKISPWFNSLGFPKILSHPIQEETTGLTYPETEPGRLLHPMTFDENNFFFEPFPSSGFLPHANKKTAEMGVYNWGKKVKKYLLVPSIPGD